MYCWRAQAQGSGSGDTHAGRNKAVVLAAGIGALGVPVPVADYDAVNDSEETGLELMQSAVGLVWRALLLWLLLLLLFELARLMAS